MTSSVRPRSTNSSRRTPKGSGGAGRPPPEDTLEGLVVASFGARVEVEGADGRRRQCNAKRGGESVVCGDRVRWSPLDGGGKAAKGGIIRERLPRRSLLSRPSTDGTLRPMAANIDRILVVVAPRPELYEGMIDRYLVAAEHFNIPAMLVVNKLDLLDDEALTQVRARLAPYTALGYDVVWASAKLDNGLDGLCASLRGHTCVFVGQSGVGKSSLVGRLLPETEIRVGEISEATGQGRHTTTTARLYHVPDSGDVVDSPGVREFSLWQMPPNEAAEGFVEFRPHLGKCRFNDCTHTHEPDCAILAAVERGEIAARRLASYHQIISPE